VSAHVNNGRDWFRGRRNPTVLHGVGGLLVASLASAVVASCAVIAGIDDPVPRATGGGDAHDEMPTAADANESEPIPDAGGHADGSEASACTAFALTYSCYNSHDSLMVPEPAQYCFGMGPDLSTAPLSQVATPSECQCVETFTCSCIVAHSTNFPCSQPSCNEGMENSKPVLVLSCP
jgi:hypothetical protein